MKASAVLQLSNSSSALKAECRRWPLQYNCNFTYPAPYDSIVSFEVSFVNPLPTSKTICTFHTSPWQLFCYSRRPPGGGNFVKLAAPLAYIFCEVRALKLFLVEELLFPFRFLHLLNMLTETASSISLDPRATSGVQSLQSNTRSQLLPGRQNHQNAILRLPTVETFHLSAQLLQGQA